MSLGVEQLQTIAAEWRDARLIYPIYRGITGRFALELSACRELESPVDSAKPEAVTAVQQWLQKTGDVIQVHQLRLFLQTSPLSMEASLAALIRHHVKKQTRSDADQDKLDFLLVQYFAQCAPADLLHTPSMQDVAAVLHPVLGDVPGGQPEWLTSLEDAATHLRRCGQLSELLQQGILAEVRKIKAAAKEAYFDTAALVAFARINFLTRQTFVRLMQTDLDAVCTGVRKLQKAGVKVINCQQAQLSSAEPLEHVLELALQGKKPFQTEYSAGNPFTKMAALRTAVDKAVAQLAPTPPNKAPAAKSSHAPAPGTSAGKQPMAPTSRAQAPAATPAARAAQQRTSAHVAAAKSRGTAAPLPVVAAQKKQAGSPVSPAGAKGSSSQQPRAATAVAGELRKVLKQLFDYLRANQERTRTTGATIVLGSSRLALSSWEVTAFVDGGEHAEVIQLAVGIRVLLFQALERLKQGGPGRKPDAVLALARNQAARLQQALVASKAAHQLEATVALSATAQRLTDILDEVAQKAAASS
jgi:hypothetical protein